MNCIVKGCENELEHGGVTVPFGWMCSPCIEMLKTGDIGHGTTFIHEYDASFNVRWEADMRAIKRWQEATGRKLVWPDHADLVVWLLEQLEGRNA